jgi:hypothetical protein
MKQYQSIQQCLKTLLVLSIALFSVNVVYAQQDTNKVQATPTPLAIKQPKAHSPRKAALLSAVIPGAGQIYNKKYWKVPVIYAGATGLIYAFNFNQAKYIEYRNAYKVRLINGPGTLGNYPRYSDSDLSTLQKSYHRYRDLSVIGGVLLYFLNVIDATVDAHLFNFSVDDNELSFQLQPTIINTAQLNQYTTGLSLSVKF